LIKPDSPGKWRTSGLHRKSHENPLKNNGTIETQTLDMWRYQEIKELFCCMAGIGHRAEFVKFFPFLNFYAMRFYFNMIIYQEHFGDYKFNVRNKNCYEVQIEIRTGMFWSVWYASKRMDM
jgi:hypothetical protein